MVGARIVDAATLPAELRERASMFCSQALSVSRFLAARAGDRFIGRLADALRAGRSVDELLGSGGALPSGVAALEREWLAWVRSGGR